MNRFLLITAVLCSTKLVPQSTAPLNSADILLHLQKLNTVGSVLYIAAHPDDENTRLLAYLAREKKVRTAYLSITRGDGGQNLIGKEQGDALGLIRTQELLAARRTDGAEQFFTRANDFGYSKNPEETFSIWGRDSILSDVVWVIRKFKPDVIVCRFPTTGEGGHGHHTASAILAVDAFTAAADPLRFPEQLRHTQPWQSKRIFWNTFNFGTVNTTNAGQLQLDVGAFNPLLGKGYGEIASESRSMHKSQGFGAARTRGKTIEYFKFIKGDSTNTDLFDGIDLSWNRFEVTSGLKTLIDDCMAKFDPLSPQKSLPDLTTIYKKLAGLETKDHSIAYWKQQKLKEVTDLLLACSGLWLEATAAQYLTVPGSECSLSVQVIKRNDGDVKLLTVRYPTDDTTANLELKTNELYTFKRTEKLAASLPFSNPYWLNESHSQSRFAVNNRLLIGTPENEPPLVVVFEVEIAGQTLQLMRPIVYKHTDPVKGEVYRPLEILPPVTINLAEKVLLFKGTTAKTIQVVLKANADKVRGTFSVTVPEGWKAETAQRNFTLAARGDEAIATVTVTPSRTAADGKISATAIIGDKTFNKSIRRIEYDHIPYQFILSDAEAKLVRTDVKLTGKKIGYIPGAGDDVAGCLQQIGYNVTILTDELLRNQDLSVYKAIITGVRAYNTNDNLQTVHQKLMDYVKKGGNLVVQYNTNSRVGPLQAKIGPLPFTVTRDRVTDEQAEVRILKPNHAAFNVPNIITPKDFEGWVQERGIYFAGDRDRTYQSLISMNDPGDKASDGSLIVAKHGKGNFVYTGLAFFRQLPAGVNGAYRLMANLISLPPNM